MDSLARFGAFDHEEDKLNVCDIQEVAHKRTRSLK